MTVPLEQTRSGSWHETSKQGGKGTIMNRVLGIAILAAGVVLIIFGINASQSFGSEVSRFFTGNPTDKSMWLLLGGIVASVVGLVLALVRPQRT